MIFWKFCRASKLKEVYQRLSLLSSINQINQIPYRCHIDVRNEVIFLADKKKVKKFLSIDNVPKDSQLVYFCSISKLVILAYNSSYFITIFILAGMYYFAQHELEYPLYEPDNDTNRQTVTIYSEVEHYLIYIFLLCYNVFGYLCCRRTALRIWHNRKNNLYYMILPKIVSKVGRQVTLKPGNMKVKYGYLSLAFIRNVHVMNGWAYYVNEDNFTTPLEYSKFIGKST